MSNIKLKIRPSNITLRTSDFLKQYKSAIIPASLFILALVSQTHNLYNLPYFPKAFVFTITQLFSPMISPSSNINLLYLAVIASLINPRLSKKKSIGPSVPFASIFLLLFLRGSIKRHSQRNEGLAKLNRNGTIAP